VAVAGIVVMPDSLAVGSWLTRRSTANKLAVAPGDRPKHCTERCIRMRFPGSQHAIIVDMDTGNHDRPAGCLRSALGRIGMGIVLFAICAIGWYTGHAFEAGPRWSPRYGGPFASSNALPYLVVFVIGVWLLLSGLRTLWIRYVVRID
jgi:hypothetical protein